MRKPSDIVEELRVGIDVSAQIVSKQGVPVGTPARALDKAMGKRILTCIELRVEERSPLVSRAVPKDTIDEKVIGVVAIDCLSMDSGGVVSCNRAIDTIDD